MPRHQIDTFQRARTISTKKLKDPLGKIVQEGKTNFRHQNEEGVLQEVQQQEVQDEKERKKDMQRKRRREKTIQNETQKRNELIQKAETAEDHAERQKLLREALKAEKKAESTQNILNNVGGEGDEGADLKRGLNLEGGTMGSFNAADGASPEPARKKPKTGMTTRPRKSKERKQAEKDLAEAAYAALSGKEKPSRSIAPKDEPSRRESLRDARDGKSKKKGEKAAASAAVAEPVAAPGERYETKGYHQIFDQINKDIARKDGPKVYRIREASLAQKASNLRKTGQLAGKEARRWQQRTNKGTKDAQARAKRTMRENMGFWKRNEREERDLRRVAERQELEQAKRAEMEREANRQKRKLNFLISQTELYSHFVGKKVKTDEVERSTDDVGAAAAVAAPKADAAAQVKLPDRDAAPSTKVTNFEDLDFDAADDSALREAAMANAYAAVQEAQDKARNFNQTEGEQAMAQFDDGELNFQDPSGLQDADQLDQPRMLTCQLKEYQLKGLSWLVNLYEQGINGILADEMGLGKTVQSISVMSYLAEKHGIWGPFLVIAPSSTLHNWQQEIVKFVPDLKVLPYWGSAKDRKVLRKFWDRKHITYGQDAPFHVLITSYQLVIQDAAYLQKMHWQYMILDEAQAIKSSGSARWRTLLNFHCRNRLLLTGTPIQNNMQELWALLHFIMPSLFDSHDEFSDWFAKDIESHAQSNTKLNEDQLKRLHVILKPFMLRRVKKHVQKELGDKIEKDVACELTYRQRALYANLRNKINFMDLLDTVADRTDDVTNLMNLVVQFRKVCNHPSLFASADISSPLALARFADCASFVREGHDVRVAYSTRALIDYDLPRVLCGPDGRLDVPGPRNPRAGFEGRYLDHLMNIWTPEHIRERERDRDGFAWLRFADTSVGEACRAGRDGLFDRAVALRNKKPYLGRMNAIYDEEADAGFTPATALFNIVERNNRQPLADLCLDGRMSSLLNVSRASWDRSGFQTMEQCARPAASAPPIAISCSNQDAAAETQRTFFNREVRQALYPLSIRDEERLLEQRVSPALYPAADMLPRPLSDRTRYTHIQVPSMRRFVSDCGKLARLDALLAELKAGGHRALVYFQMTRMMDLMEEYMTYRGYRYLRLDGSTKLEDRRDRVHDFQTRPDIFVFLLSTRAGGLGINLTSADTVIFYDSDWNPTIDSQAMDRAHRLGQTRQVTVYRLITHGTVEERIRKRALQKEEVQRVVIQGGAGGSGVDFNTRSKENKAKDIAMWLADDEQAEILEQREREAQEKGEGAEAEGAGPAKRKKKAPTGARRKEVNMDDMYHEGAFPSSSIIPSLLGDETDRAGAAGEGHFDDANRPSGTATPALAGGESDAAAAAAATVGPGGKRGPRGGRGLSKKAKSAKERLAIADGNVG